MGDNSVTANRFNVLAKRGSIKSEVLVTEELERGFNRTYYSRMDMSDSASLG